QPPRAADALLAMLHSLNRRGPDSAGVALYGPPVEGGFVVRAWYGEDDEAPVHGTGATRPTRATRASRAIHAVKDQWAVPTAEETAGYLRLEVTTDAPAGEVADVVDHAGLEVFSVGRSLEIVKHEMRAEVLGRTYGLFGFPARHGIGHTRMATESRVDVAHAHPFWARPFEDIAVVHNGHITNYHKLRRVFEMRGHRFHTGNDSELIAVYIADRMGKGFSLSEAVRASVSELDGSFTYLISTAEGFGVARDQFASKPGVIYEDEEVVAVASEEHAIFAALGEKRALTREVQAKEVLTWAA
ncbi:MAG: glutamine amidotransferase, partial [Actinobacteria bacterium]|nr:glutamine amidotransferase [Actinomycetota bacterium]